MPARVGLSGGELSERSDVPDAGLGHAPREPRAEHALVDVLLSQQHRCQRVRPGLHLHPTHQLADAREVFVYGLIAHHTTRGEHTVQPERILCDMDTPNGPWTVLQWDTVAFQQSPAHGVVNADAPGWAVGYAESGNYWNALTTTGFYIELEGATKYVWEDVVLHGTSNRPTPGFLFTGGRVQSWGCDAAGTNGQCHITDQATGRHWGQWVNQTGCCGQGAGTWYYSEASGENNLNYGMCEHLYPNGDVGSSQGCADFTSISPPGSQVFRFAIRH